jgi:hypothetical protein
MSWSFKIENGDLVRTSYNNGYEEINGLAKLKQDVEMTLSTSVRWSTGVGCSLDEVIGMSTMNPISSYMQFPAIVEFQTRVMTGMNRLKYYLNNTQIRERTTSEQILEVSPVQIWPNNDDPRNYRWRIDVLSVSGSDVAIGGTVR